MTAREFLAHPNVKIVSEAECVGDNSNAWRGGIAEQSGSMNDDPRLGRVSASRFEILALCPGSEQLRRTLPPEALDSEDEYTKLGTKLHKAWETERSFDLSEPEMGIYARGLNTLNEILLTWLSDFQNVDYVEGQRELRLYLNDPNTLQPIASGQLDRHYIAGVSVLICDFKGLWAPNLTPAERNWQGRLQAVLAAKEYDARHVRMAFIKAMFGKQDVVDYDATALQYAEQSIHRAIWESELAGSQRRPGAHCRYCACKAWCPEAASYATLPAIPERASLDDRLAIVQTMPLEDLVPVWRKWGEITKILEAIESRLRALPSEEHERLGLSMKPGRKIERVKDVLGAFNALRESGFSSEDILACMDLKKGAVLELIKTVRNVRESEAEAMWENGLDTFIERNRAEASLVEKP